MRVGLVRHFKVNAKYPEKKWITSSELDQWFEAYDASDIEKGEVDLHEIQWKKCYSSDLYRAEKTADAIFNGKVIKILELREVKTYPIFKNNIKLPFLCWAVLIRLAWLINHKSQLETKKLIQERIRALFDQILLEDDENILIVSHGALMIFLRKELLRRGYKGPRMGSPENGRLYLFEK